jgi:transglutaminase-like putative cysteine protease
MKHRCCAIFSICLILAALFTESTAGAATKPGLSRGEGTRQINLCVVNQDGSYVETIHSVRHIGDETDVKQVGQVSISYNGSLQHVQVLQAYTLKPDGSHIVVEPGQIKDTEEPQFTDPPMFQDMRLVVLGFPEVAVGDRVVLEYTLQQITPFFPSIFIDGANSDQDPGAQVTIIYDMPEGMPLYADNVGYILSNPQGGAGRKLYQWDYVPMDYQRPEAGSVSPFDRGHRLVVSTLSNMADLAKAYDRRAHDKVKPTSRIAALARTVTRGLRDSRAKAYALDNWVRKNIRYVALYIGAGGFVAHDSDTILDNLYGDCKDHSTLLQALLAAVNIDSTGALINAGNQYTLPSVASLVFNHEITYLPSLGLYLDSTGANLAPGYLGQQELDKPTLLVRSGKIGHTPAAQDAFVHSVTDIKMHKDGSADFTSVEYIRGMGAEIYRGAVRNMKPVDRNRKIENVLRSLGQHGAGTLETSDLNSTAPDFRFGMRGHSADFMDLPGPVGVVVPASFGNEIALGVTALIQEKERTQSFSCFNFELGEQVHVSLPAAIDVLAMPKGLVLRDGNFDYTSEYLHENGAIIIKRRFQLHHRGAVCSPADYKLMQPALRKMAADVRSQVIVQSR